MTAPDGLSAAWVELAGRTTARVGLGDSGAALPTAARLAFQADHALARDAVHAVWDAAGTRDELESHGATVIEVQTGAITRSQYLLDPAAGRRLAPSGTALLTTAARERAARGHPPWDVLLIVSDGLSATATQTHAVPLIAALLPRLRSAGLTVAPIVLAPFARVGLLNAAGAAAGARSSVILLGERPGLSAPDGLSAYFEFAPSAQLTDADRNCISNIRPAALPPAAAALQLAALVEEGCTLRLSGTALKLDLPAAVEAGRPQLD